MRDKMSDIERQIVANMLAGVRHILASQAPARVKPADVPEPRWLGLADLRRAAAARKGAGIFARGSAENNGA